MQVSLVRPLDIMELSIFWRICMGLLQVRTLKMDGPIVWVLRHPLSRKAKVPYLRLVEAFPDGEVLFEHCSRFAFEGIVSKRRSSRYSSGPSRNWVKTKCPAWKRANSERWRIFEGPRKPEMMETQKTLARKREQLARVIERLRSPPLSHGIAHELRKQQSILEREIAELERI